MDKKIVDFLNKLGCPVNEQAQAIIRECDAWYSGEIVKDFHERLNINNVKITLKTMNFAKRCCADDANLCEVVEVNASENEAQFEAINEILAANRFDVMYRKQLEKMSACGTVGAYIRIDNAIQWDDGTLSGGDVCINYCDAENIYPLTVVNDEITECAFVGENITRGKKESVLVIFTKDDGLNAYMAETHVFVDGKEDVNKQSIVALGEVRPFAIMKTAEVNNRKNMEGYGYPKVFSSIPVLQALDLSYNILYGDLDKGEKIVFINELLSCVQTLEGIPTLTPQQKKLFVLLGEKLPDQDSVIKEYNPILRIDEITKIFETCLSLLSLSFGFGTKKYTFENGQIKSATEYIGEKQDCLQELNKQRKSATDYIRTIVRAVKWFSNTFNQTDYNIDEEINVDFDDSYITDRTSELERKRNDALSFDIPMLKVWYLMDAYNLAEDEAKKLVFESEDAAGMDADGEEDDS